LPHFNVKIKAKLSSQEPFVGLGVPAEASFISLFGDGARVEVCRPDGPFEVQASVFSGDKW
jgi:hypothetical protein